MVLGVAVLGTGRIVETGYVPAFRNIEGANLVAILSRDQGRADSFAKEHKIAKAYSDLDALLDDPNVNACSASATPARVRGLERRRKTIRP